jgi:hypothetical protein
MTLSSGSAGPVRLRERTKGKELAQGIWFRTGNDRAAPACDLLPVLEARRAVDLADCRVVDRARRQRLGLEVQHGGVRRRHWRLGRSPERNEGNSPFPSRVQTEKVLDVPIRETRDDLGCESQSRGHGKQVRVERSAVPEDVAVGSLSVLPGVAPVRRGARDDDRRPSQRWLGAGSLDERASVVTDTQAPKREVVHAEVVDARWQIREVTAGEIEVDVVESARVRCRPEVDAAAGGAPDLRDPGRVVEDAGERPVTRHLLGWPGLSPDQGRDGAERRDGSGLELTRERDRLEIAVELERDRLVLPVEVVRARAQPLLGVLRPLVIAAGDLDVLVRHTATLLPAPRDGADGAR